jgi:hypothetical protein
LALNRESLDVATAAMFHTTHIGAAGARASMSNTNGRSDAVLDTPPTLTTRQGHPVVDNQNNRTIGDRGPTVLENYHFLEKISHFDRERIPGRVVQGGRR